MKWNEIDLLVSPAATDLVALLVYECGSNGSIIHDDEMDEWGRIRITAYFPEEKDHAIEDVQTQLEMMAKDHAELENWQLVSTVADDESWLYAWQTYFHPKKISKTFWAEPAWEKAAPSEGERTLTINPGLAFGSGFHDTTCMCVQYLEDVVRPGHRVYDIGTGTGILAIAAAKLGAAEVVAVDFDEKAVVQAHINSALNGVEDRLSICHSDLLTAVSADAEGADVVVANLVTNAVLALLPSLPDYLKPGAVCIASGIIDDRIDEVRAKAKEVGFVWDDERLTNGWYAIKLRWLS